MARVVGGPTLLGTGFFFGDIYRSLYAGFDDYFRNLVPSSKRDCQPAELLDKKVRLIQYWEGREKGGEMGGRERERILENTAEDSDRKSRGELNGTIRGSKSRRNAHRKTERITCGE
jgi:hypothetical protein